MARFVCSLLRHSIVLALMSSSQAAITPAAFSQTTSAQGEGIEQVSDGGWKFGGEVALRGRYFFDDPLYYGQSDDSFVPMLEARLNATGSWGGGMHRAVFEAYGRLDSETDTSLFDLPEAYYQYVGSNGSLLLGSHTEFWGVAESYNPVNIINQKDNIADIRSRMSLGQPMAKLELNGDALGTISLYGLFGFRERQYGNDTSRFRSPFVVDEDLDEYEDERDIDFAARYSNSVDVGDGSLDFALSYFNGTNRDPKLLPACVRKGGAITKHVCDRINAGIVRIFEEQPKLPLRKRIRRVRQFVENNFNDDVARALSGLESIGLQPYYQHLEQVGLEAVYGFGNFQAKFEGAWKQASGENYFSGVGGIEYTINNFANSDATVSLIGEYLYDDRSYWQPYTAFDDDIFGAVRVGFNDVNNTSLTAGAFYDLNTDATLGVFEFSTRLSDVTKLEVTANVFDTNGWNDSLAIIAHDSYVDVKLSAFF